MTNAEIQVGEYIRTKMFGIGKVTYKYKNLITYNTGKSSITEKYEGQNHSFNLIDLIEVGDYVNGKEIKEIGIIRIGLYKGQKAVFTQISDGTYFKNEDIKTIATKEQFKAMEYKVGGEDDQQR